MSEAVKEHRWMEMSYTPVEVIRGNRTTDDPITIPMGPPLVGVSCFDCHLPLNTDALDRPCEKESADASG